VWTMRNLVSWFKVYTNNGRRGNDTTRTTQADTWNQENNNSSSTNNDDHSTNGVQLVQQQQQQQQQQQESILNNTNSSAVPIPSIHVSSNSTEENTNNNNTEFNNINNNNNNNTSILDSSSSLAVTPKKRKSRSKWVSSLHLIRKEGSYHLGFMTPRESKKCSKNYAAAASTALVNWADVPYPFDISALDTSETDKEINEIMQNEELLEAYDQSEIHMAAILGNLSHMNTLVEKHLGFMTQQYNDINNDHKKEIIAKFCSTKKGEKWNTPLHIATFKDQFEVVKFLVECCFVDVNEVNKEEATSLHCACAKNRRVIAQFLLDHGANVKARDEYGYSPLQIALKAKNFDIADDLVHFGAALDFKRFDGKTALHIMAEQGNIEGLKFLLEKHQCGAVFTKDQKGNIPLICAVKKNKTEAVRYLCSYHRQHKNIGQVLRHKNELGRNVMHVAVDDLDKEENAYAMVRTLIESLFVDETLELLKELLNERDKACCYTPLHCATRRNYSEVVKLLLISGSDVNIVDENGNTALHLALCNKKHRLQDEEVFEKNRLLTLQRLIEHPRCKIDIKNKSKQNAKMIIRSSKNDQFKKLLKDQRKLRISASSYYLSV
jgi:ankyrin repeat protein